MYGSSTFCVLRVETYREDGGGGSVDQKGLPLVQVQLRLLAGFLGNPGRRGVGEQPVVDVQPPQHARSG